MPYNDDDFGKWQIVKEEGKNGDLSFRITTGHVRREDGEPIDHLLFASKHLKLEDGWQRKAQNFDPGDYALIDNRAVARKVDFWILDVLVINGN